jgi:16S rRNA (cytosine967-C5)-methyltransferase
MPRPKLRSPRAVAATVLSKTDPRKDYISPVFDELIERTEQKQRATDLVFGTIKNRALIDLAIEKISACPAERIPAGILNILRIGFYELIYCPQTAEYAIVDENVENARRTTNNKQTGFANAVLRRATRHIKNRTIPLDQAEPRNTIPQTPAAGCEFDIPLLPNPSESPQGYLSSAFSLPRWLGGSWLNEFGEEKTRQICFASNRRPSVYLRPNRLKTTAEELAERLKADGVKCDTAAELQMIRLTSPKAVIALPGFAEGLFTVQDLSAAEPVRLLNPQPVWTILDLCAAPGTKTTQLAELTNDNAKIIATDIDGSRLAMVRENIDRLGIKSVAVVEYENLHKIARQAGPFDCVLLDVPCSNTGVLAKRPEVRYRITKDAIEKLAETQIELLRRAAKMLKPGGVICYSTCSIQPAENRLLIKRFLAENQTFRLISEKLILPFTDPFDHDGGYAAIIGEK